MRKLRPLALFAVAGAVVDSAVRPALAAELGKQGLPPQALQPPLDALAAFRAAQPAPRQAIDARALANATLDTHYYDGYVQARKIVNSGGGSGKAAGTPVPTA